MLVALNHNNTVSNEVEIKSFYKNNKNTFVELLQ